MFQDVKSAGGEEADDVARALSVAEEALEAGKTDEAIPLLEWAKAAASRSWAVREALGIAYYLSGRFKDAHRELLTYRRLAGSQDQNHLLADCARATGDSEKARTYIEAMLDADVDESRVVEGLIVLAGERADRGDVEGGLAALERAPEPEGGVELYHLRLWYLAAQLHSRSGREEQAEALRGRIAEYDEGFLKAMDQAG